jgi:hypothetical protein
MMALRLWWLNLYSTVRGGCSSVTEGSVIPVVITEK